MNRSRTSRRGGRSIRSYTAEQAQPKSNDSSSEVSFPASGELDQVLKRIRQDFGDSSDVLIRRLVVGKETAKQAALVYMNGLVDHNMVSEFVTESLLDTVDEEPDRNDAEGWIQFLLHRTITSGEVQVITEWKDMLLSILSGNSVIVLDGCEKVISVGTQGGEARSVSEPTSQLVVRGPKDSFVESVVTNVSLVRRRIKSPDVRLENMKIGNFTNTRVSMMYIQNIAEKRLVDEVRRRLQSIDTESILESAYIEEFIQDHTFTPFPTIFNSERPDVAAGNLLEGRIVLFVDGTPFVLIMPAALPQFFHSAEDYSQRFDISILMRFVRYLSFIVLILGPAVYIALTTFHYEMIPTQMLISLMAQREGVPFPAFVEAVLMETAFEILREAGVRMPRAIGQTVSIVGALILGQAVVEAGIITPVMVIVVALTGIASFAIPAYNLSIAGRLIRFFFMILAGMFGFYGITLGLIVLVAHLNSLRSFGMPYLTPFSPFVLSSQKDTVLIFPFWALRKSGSPQSPGSPQGGQQPGQSSDQNSGQRQSSRQSPEQSSVQGSQNSGQSSVQYENQPLTPTEERKAENKLQVEPLGSQIGGKPGRWGKAFHKLPEDEDSNSSKSSEEGNQTS
ncbi:spore germination protein [Paenibacillus zeisoli]|uniref:Spore germination protein n=1 Tax=Paenibacillus zeisoli TaxID=2496267 RepID=A0A3S1DAE0_9BACL|nr:spore germination protein [Paenibacillus zeisoli]RUT33368.1 spore germination protein [Paenibacillus zeisoli]